MADLKDTYVVHGACSTCTHGMRESRIVLERTHGVFLKDRALMTINDCKPENIICFGGCYSMENPDTAAEAQKVQMAVEKDCPNTFTDTVMNFFTKKDKKESSDASLRVVGICTPKIISAEWNNGGNTVEVNGEVPLLAGAKVYCLYGGEIEIIDSGQPEAGDMSQVEISLHSVPLSGSPGGNAESAALGAVAAGIAATPGMPKQAVAGMIGASEASGYDKSKSTEVGGTTGEEYVSAAQLIAIGWNKDVVTSDMVKELNRALEEYGITDINSIRHFIAQASHESDDWNYKGYGDGLIEIGSDSYLKGQKYWPYIGAGYIHITWEYNYQKFSDYLKKEKGIDDPLIMSEGPKRIASTYAWESAAWFWSIFTNANEVASHQDVNPDDLSKIINKYDVNSFSTRANIYNNKVVSNIK